VKEKADQGKESLVEKEKSHSNHSSTVTPLILDETDKVILQELQDDFPLVQEPWLEISRRLNISQAEVLTRSKRLIEGGAILKVGPVLNPSAIGLTAATLVAMRVPKNKISKVARVINEHRNVTHNYERENEYNVWFTLAAPTSEELAITLDEIKRKTGVQERDILDLPTVRRFKINMRFQLAKMTS